MKLIARTTIVASISAIALSGAVLPAHAASVTVRAENLIGAPLDDTRATGHKEFLRDGLHLWTEGNTSTDKVTAYFPIGTVFPASASYDWDYTYPSASTSQPLNQPGAQLIFDYDAITGNGNDYNVLVGEAVYSANPGGTELTDWWLTNGSSAAAKAVAPSTTGGSGSAFHGSLAAWKAALPADARVIAGGVSLGSGVRGDGVLSRMTYGSDVFEFTNLAVSQDGEDGAPGPQGPAGPAGATGATGATGPQGAPGTVTVVNANGKYAFAKVTGGAKVTLLTDAGKTGEVVGKKVRWVIKADNKKQADLRQGLGAKDVIAVRFAKGSGKHEITIKKDGAVVRTIKIRA